VDYSRQSDDDINFLYNPFPVPVLDQVVDHLIARAATRETPTWIIYSERTLETSPTLVLLEQKTALKRVLFHSSWGQAFHVFKIERTRAGKP
jgi:hypothetical protein